jgi:hypothetical protein
MDLGIVHRLHPTVPLSVVPGHEGLGIVETTCPGVTAIPAPTPNPAPPASPLARLAIAGVRVLLVPQSFRYEEVPAGASEEELFFNCSNKHISSGR